MAVTAADLVNFPAPTQFTIPIHWDTILEEDEPLTLKYLGLDEFQCDLNDYILLLQSASGTTSWGSLLTTNGACMRKQSDHQAGGWDEMLRRGRNKAMHSSNGNSSMFFLLLSLLIACSSAMLTARASTVDLLFFVNLFSCIFSLQCAMKLCSTRKRCRNHISRCRFVRNQRKKVFHRLHRWNRMR